MAGAEEYARWIVQNADKRGTPEFDIVSRAYQAAKQVKATDPTEGMSTGEKVLAGTGRAMTNVVRGVGQRLGMVDQKTIDEAEARDAPLMRTGAGQVGDVLGKIAVAVPTAFIPGANTVAGGALIGAALGAAEPTKTGDSVAKNMAYGGIGGGVGQMAGQALGRALRPVQAPPDPQRQLLIQAAQRHNIPLDAADLTGSRPLTVMRDVMANMPLTADNQAAIQAAKQAAFNRAVSGTYGGADDVLTPAALQGSRDRIGQQFTDLSARNAATIDQNVLTRMADVVDNANRYSTPDVARVVGNFADDVLSRVNQNDVLPGAAYRALDSQMGRTMRSTTNGDIRHAVGDLRNALREAMDASIAPADQAAWREARRQYANLMTVAPLAARDPMGNVSGRTLLAAALRQNRNGAFTGAGDLGELGRVGRTFVAEQTPNSGTAQRLFMQRFLENPLSATWQQGAGGISLPVQAAMNSPAGIHYLTQGAAQLTPRQQALVNALMRTGGTVAPLTNGE